MPAVLPKWCAIERSEAMGPRLRGDDSQMIDSTSLIFPALGDLYQALAPWAYALLRVAVGLALVPHGLRNTFGMFPKTGVRSHSIGELAKQLDHDGYYPGKLWAPAISL